jgi:hypothetical protein
MAEKSIDDLIECQHITRINYKSRDGSIKEIQVKQHLDPDQRRMTHADIQALAKQIAIVLKEDAF